MATLTEPVSGETSGALFRALRSAGVDADLAYSADGELRSHAGQNVIAVLGARFGMTARTSLRLLAVLDVLSSTPARAKRLAPRPDGPLTHFASPRGEKSRLTVHDLGSAARIVLSNPRQNDRRRDPGIGPPVTGSLPWPRRSSSVSKAEDRYASPAARYAVLRNAELLGHAHLRKLHGPCATREAHGHFLGDQLRGARLDLLALSWAQLPDFVLHIYRHRYFPLVKNLKSRDSCLVFRVS